MIVYTKVTIHSRRYVTPMVYYRQITSIWIVSIKSSTATFRRLRSLKALGSVEDVVKIARGDFPLRQAKRLAAIPEENLKDIAEPIRECGWEIDPRIQVLLSLVTLHSAKFTGYLAWKRSGRLIDLRKVSSTGKTTLAKHFASLCQPRVLIYDPLSQYEGFSDECRYTPHSDSLDEFDGVCRHLRATSKITFTVEE